MQNGGHLQFFVNDTREHAEETVGALGALGAACHARVLEQAVARWSSVERYPNSDLDYQAEQAKGEFRDLDRAFSDCEPSLTEVLKRHLAEHEADYIIRK